MLFQHPASESRSYRCLGNISYLLPPRYPSALYVILKRVTHRDSRPKYRKKVEEARTSKSLRRVIICHVRRKVVAQDRIASHTNWPFFHFLLRGYYSVVTCAESHARTTNNERPAHDRFSSFTALAVVDTSLARANFCRKPRDPPRE